MKEDAYSASMEGAALQNAITTTSKAVGKEKYAAQVNDYIDDVGNWSPCCANGTNLHNCKLRIISNKTSRVFVCSCELFEYNRFQWQSRQTLDYCPKYVRFADVNSYTTAFADTATVHTAVDAERASPFTASPSRAFKKKSL